MASLRLDRVIGCPLDSLVEGIEQPGLANVMVTGITANSREVEPGSLYVALPGTRTHGARYCEAALAAGAVAVLTDDEGAQLAPDCERLIVSTNLRADMGRVAAKLFGNPASALDTYAITGTNGKTTTAFLIEAALGTTNVATIGTIGFRVSGEELTTSRTTVTTPESPDLQALLAVMVERGATSVAVEVSSHALVLDRIAGMRFDVSGFVNLGHDHLDFHGTAQAYFEAKAKLFTSALSDRGVINIGDPAGRVIAERMRAAGDIALTTVGANDADWFIESVDTGEPLARVARMRTPYGPRTMRLSMPGNHNCSNAMLALAMCDRDGSRLDARITALESARIPGRMQPVELGPDAPLVVVDFAHTPQAVEAALGTFAPYRKDRRIIVVLGAGGDRDPDKRFSMGRSAALSADLVVVTDDNPRTEDPALIRQAVLAGTKGVGHAIAIGGRGAAIRTALEAANSGDIVVILGKGHERGQILANKVIDFDDVVQAKQQWAECSC